MNTVKGLLGLRTEGQQVPNFEDDHIYPATLLDDTRSLRDMVLHWTFLFNDVLDAEKLRDSLARLLDIGDWRKLGGRYRVNVSTVNYLRYIRLTRDA